MFGVALGWITADWSSAPSTRVLDMVRVDKLTYRNRRGLLDPSVASDRVL
jgi:hypothetical protein